MSGLGADLCCHLPCLGLLCWCELSRELLPAVRARSDEEPKNCGVFCSEAFLRLFLLFLNFQSS